jgi:hypothetical protein
MRASPLHHLSCGSYNLYECHYVESGLPIVILSDDIWLAEIEAMLFALRSSLRKKIDLSTFGLFVFAVDSTIAKSAINHGHQCNLIANNMVREIYELTGGKIKVIWIEGLKNLSDVPPGSSTLVSGTLTIASVFEHSLSVLNEAVDIDLCPVGPKPHDADQFDLMRSLCITYLLKLNHSSIPSRRFLCRL